MSQPSLLRQPRHCELTGRNDGITPRCDPTFGAPTSDWRLHGGTLPVVTRSQRPRCREQPEFFAPHESSSILLEVLIEMSKRLPLIIPAVLAIGLSSCTPTPEIDWNLAQHEANDFTEAAMAAEDSLGSGSLRVGQETSADDEPGIVLSYASDA